MQFQSDWKSAGVHTNFLKKLKPQHKSECVKIIWTKVIFPLFMMGVTNIPKISHGFY